MKGGGLGLVAKVHNYLSPTPVDYFLIIQSRKTASIFVVSPSKLLNPTWKRKIGTLGSSLMGFMWIWSRYSVVHIAELYVWRGVNHEVPLCWWENLTFVINELKWKRKVQSQTDKYTFLCGTMLLSHNNNCVTVYKGYQLCRLKTSDFLPGQLVFC